MEADTQGRSKLTAIRPVLLALACVGLASCTHGAPPQQSSESAGTIAEPQSAASPASPAEPRGRTGEPQPVLVGTVTYVYDGDTIKVKLRSGPIIVRLHSIDAPEHDQPWGPEAAAALASRVQGRKVSLAVVTHDSYERLVADVLLDDESVDAWMVQQGDAWAYRHYLDDKSYCSWEGEARTGRRGLWSKSPDTWRAPWQWRAKERGEIVAFTDYSHETVAHCVATVPAHVPPADASASTVGAPVTVQPRSSDCLIKGNIGAKGRIYHVPGSDSYDDTRIDESKGERWFCSQAEARAAGWRPPADR